MSIERAEPSPRPGRALALLSSATRLAQRLGWNVLDDRRAGPTVLSLYERVRPAGLTLAFARGVPLLVDADRRGIAPRLLLNRCYEPLETAAFLALADDATVVVDCGANIGYYTALAATHGDATRTVHAFEPEAGNFELLRRNTARWRERVHVHQVALGDRRGDALLYADARSNTRPALAASAVRTPGEPHRVATETLDRYFAERGHPAGATLVKLDVQGAEGRVLDGANDFLRACRPRLLVELWPHGLRAHGSDPYRVVARLREQSYRLSIVGLGEAGRVDDVVAEAERRWPGGRGHLTLVARPA